MWRIAVLLSLAACAGAPRYPTCEVADDCGAPDDVVARCLVGDADFRFCSWECELDADCEQADDWRRVCSTFQSEAGSFCLPSCAQDPETEEESCPRGFVCRSTGGGAPQRVCYPG